MTQAASDTALLKRTYNVDHLQIDPGWKPTWSPADGSVRSDKIAIEDKNTVKHENGRTYHALSEGTYFLPNDVDEQTRLNWQHEMVGLILDGKLGLAPVETPKNVLDVATGTGIWAIEYAQKHPEAIVYGSDLSEIQPTDKAKNCKFVTTDVEKEEWNFPEPFDYVHLRYTLTCFDQPKKVIQNAYNSMASGGYIEFFDPVAVFESIKEGASKGSVHEEWLDAVNSASAKLGRDMLKPLRYKTWLEEVGFVDVVEKVFPLALGDWPRDPHQKTLGRHLRLDMLLLSEMMKKLLLAAGWEQAKVDDLVARYQDELRSPTVFMYHPLMVVYGKKP